jgi:hypothetical protein
VTNPRSITRIKGGVTVRDYRGTGLCPPNGGRITPHIFVQHIPVIHNQPGVGDLEALARVLKVQGLAVQFGTDAEGNVARFTYANELCYHARGANSISAGCEHMHFGTGEEWTSRQYRAAAWVAWKMHKEHGIPLRGAHLLPGAGITRVARTGHTSHMVQSRAAGFNDRTDPGSLFRFGHVYELARYFDRHHRF